ncbi:hypothetical protein HERIO_553 [Hepatospora eriocheir]|uniref:Uncharacterized protein n=1 Tax=Hepatospora eriocheir TaxID=1081669 RepID=A0A1X0QD45_9MICR|nr:hypothetical protein HERIO_553 [Hepatospora eriocheir]
MIEGTENNSIEIVFDKNDYYFVFIEKLKLYYKTVTKLDKEKKKVIVNKNKIKLPLSKNKKIESSLNLFSTLDESSFSNIYTIGSSTKLSKTDLSESIITKDNVLKTFSNDNESMTLSKSITDNSTLTDNSLSLNMTCDSSSISEPLKTKKKKKVFKNGRLRNFNPKKVFSSKLKNKVDKLFKMKVKIIKKEFNSKKKEIIKERKDLDKLLNNKLIFFK